MLAFRSNVPLFLVLLVLAGCTTRGGVAEFQSYKKSFDDSAEASTALIDRLAAAERQVGQFSRFRANNYGVDPKFIPGNSVYFSDTDDPPLAKEYRRAMVTISAYNDLMLAYATGQGFKDLTVRAQLIANESSGLVSSVAGESLFLGGYLGVLNSIAKFALSERSRAVFQKQFRETSPKVIVLLDQMRAATPTVFKNLTFFINLDIENVQSGIASGDLNKLRKQHQEARILLSDWVILLEKQADAIRATQRAIDNPRLGIILSGSAEAISELRATADTVRAHLASTAVN